MDSNHKPQHGWQTKHVHNTAKLDPKKPQQDTPMEKFLEKYRSQKKNQAQKKEKLEIPFSWHYSLDHLFKFPNPCHSISFVSKKKKIDT